MIINKDVSTIEITWKKLHHASYDFNQPFVLHVADKHVFAAQEVVRILPQKRIVAFGTWMNRQVVIKLFFDPKHAKRHMEADAAGIKKLKEYNIPSPSLLYQGNSPDKKIHVLIFERIVDAQNLETHWLNRTADADVLPLLQSVILEIATQHVFGLCQQDLHLKNFLVTEKIIYTLDGAQITAANEKLNKKTSMENVAWFLSQLGVGQEILQEQLFRFYARSRGWLIKQQDIIELFILIQNIYAKRWQKFVGKIFRNCTDYVEINQGRFKGMLHRKYAGPEFRTFAANPDQVFHRSDVTFLKQGRSATVIKVCLDNHDYVIKRYNLKNIFHALRRCLRNTRALTVWRLGHKLSLFGVNTPQPVAFIESKVAGFRGRSYFVTEYIKGQHAGEYFAQTQDSRHIQSMIERILALFKQIAQLELSHGDLKITNILINADLKPVIIDLDGGAEHSSLASLHKTWKKELKRFVANFNQQPDLANKVETTLCHYFE